MLSLVIPVYKNEANIDRLLVELVKLDAALAEPMEVVFVVDGSPDRSYDLLHEQLPALPLRAQLIRLSRNFGSFSAIRAGMAAGIGDSFAVLAADLQEPPELIAEFASILRAGEAEIVFGYRSSRSDPWTTQLTSKAFWALYRRFVLPDMPPGGIDVFACTRVVRDRVMAFREVDTNLIALLFWVGYRRRFVAYDRLARLEGTSAWTLSKKIRYSVDSVFNFTDLPIRVLTYVGFFGMIAAVLLAVMIIVAKVVGAIPVPGYAPIVLTIAFFGALTSLGLGILGQYLWLTLQNVRGRPNFIAASEERIDGTGAGDLLAPAREPNSESRAPAARSPR
ncbi:MAG TPA: glycosyltransferase family 2 protein [Candidatus Elarobacter sp.]|jgi:glycosyltransferase involved in cell wall biosynthesis